MWNPHGTGPERYRRDTTGRPPFRGRYGRGAMIIGLLMLAWGIYDSQGNGDEGFGVIFIVLGGLYLLPAVLCLLNSLLVTWLHQRGPGG